MIIYLITFYELAMLPIRMIYGDMNEKLSAQYGVSYLMIKSFVKREKMLVIQIN